MIATVLYARVHLIKSCFLSTPKTSAVFNICLFLDLSGASGAMCYQSFRFDPKMSFCPVRKLWRFIFSARDIGVHGPNRSRCSFLHQVSSICSIDCLAELGEGKSGIGQLKDLSIFSVTRSAAHPNKVPTFTAKSLPPIRFQGLFKGNGAGERRRFWPEYPITPICHPAVSFEYWCS